MLNMKWGKQVIHWLKQAVNVIDSCVIMNLSVMYFNGSYVEEVLLYYKKEKKPLVQVEFKIQQEQSQLESKVQQYEPTGC